MPAYEFECRKCGKEFTLVLSVSEYEKKGFTCPECRSQDVEQLVTSAQVITSKKS
jgi:putative FmdB family regulatory protein